MVDSPALGFDATQIELLAGLAADVQQLVAGAFEPVEFAFGDVLMREGEPADSYWVLCSGRLRVVREGADGGEVTLATLEPGATFGEGALLQGGVRTSTVRASTAGTALRLDAAVLRSLASTQPSVAAHLASMRRRHEVSDLLRLASPLARMAGSALPAVIDRLAPVVLAQGEALTLGGRAVGHAEVAGANDDPGRREPLALFLVEEGKLVVRAQEDADGASGRAVRYLRRGDLVGEAAMLSGSGGGEILEAVTDASLLRLTKADLDAVVAAHPEMGVGLEHLAALYERQQAAWVPLDFAGDGALEEADGAGRSGGAADAVGALATDSAPGAQATSEGIDAAIGTEIGDSNAPGDAATRVRDAFPIRRRLRRPPVIRQIDEMDCGVAALAMICQYHGKRVALSRLRTMVGASVDGTSAAGLLAAARSLGFEARALKASKSELPRLPVPFIAHWRGDHWVVVTLVSASTVFFDDPALGRRRVPIDEFREGWSGYVLEAAPGPAFERGGARRADMEWVGRLVHPYRRRIGAVAAMSVALSALQLSLEVVIQIVVDRVVGTGHGAHIGSVFAVLAGVTVVLTIGTLGQRLLLLRTAAALDRDGLQVLSERLLSLPLSYFSSRRTGDLQRRLDGVRMARAAMTDIALVGLALAAQLLASLGLLFYYSVPIALVFCVCVPLYLAITRYSVTRLAPATASLEEEAGRYASRQVEVVKGIETAKALAAEGPLQASLVEHQSVLNARQIGVDRLRAVYGALTQGLGFAILAGFLALGASEVVGHSLSIGGLVACVTLIALATSPMEELVVLADGLQQARTLTDRAQDVFDTEPEQGEERAHLSDVPSISGHVTLKDVTFTYAEGSPPVLEHITVDIPAGATVAVVGRSGSGKTTFARCVAALVAPTSGTVCFDDVDATTLDHRQLRSHIGLVLQETYLFSDTIEANIAFGAPLDPVRVREAAQLANAADFVERLPLGYATKVGESGLALSGGQRQRLAIARALYRQPALLVLDEATSALDAESERAIQENLGRVLGDRTAIVIAHRLSTVRHADLILVLDRGRLVEQGTHDELVARRGLYFLLTAQQLDL